MATPCKTPFELKLIGHRFGKSQDKEILYFTKELEELLEWPEAYYIEVMENTDYDLYFNAAHSQARLYIEGLEYTETEKVYFDENNQQYYRCADQEAFTWFRWNQSEQSLIPGTYYVKIYVEGIVYYTLLKIKPLRVDEDALVEMKEELKSFMQAYKELSLGTKEIVQGKKSYGLTQALDKQLNIMMSWHQKLIIIFAEIRRIPHEQIQKTYQYTPIQYAKKVDHNSIKRTLKNKYEPDKAYSYSQTVDYDTQENRWFKSLNEKFIRLIGNIPFEHLTAEQRIVCQKLQAMCQGIRQHGWYEAITYKSHESFPIRSMYNSRYRQLYAFERELWASQEQLVLQKVNAHFWQQTSLIYELWCFVTVYKVLTENLGYTHCNINQTHLAKELSMDLRCDQIQLKLVYDALIPIHPHQTQRETMPLYALSPIHRKPDGRIDIYKQGEYCGSILLEMKYSNSNNVWHEERKTRCSEQLLHYAYQFNSIYKRNPYRLPEKILNQINPVQGVLVMVPQLKASTKLIEDQETIISLAEITVGSDLALVETHLKKGIDYCVNII